MLIANSLPTVLRRPIESTPEAIEPGEPRIAVRPFNTAEVRQVRLRVFAMEVRRVPAEHGRQIGKPERPDVAHIRP